MPANENHKQIDWGAQIKMQYFASHLSWSLARFNIFIDDYWLEEWANHCKENEFQGLRTSCNSCVANSSQEKKKKNHQVECRETNWPICKGN